MGRGWPHAGGCPRPSPEAGGDVQTDHLAVADVVYCHFIKPRMPVHHCSTGSGLVSRSLPWSDPRGWGLGDRDAFYEGVYVGAGVECEVFQGAFGDARQQGGVAGGEPDERVPGVRVVGYVQHRRRQAVQHARILRPCEVDRDIARHDPYPHPLGLPKVLP